MSRTFQGEFGLTAEIAEYFDRALPRGGRLLFDHLATMQEG